MGNVDTKWRVVSGICTLGLNEIYVAHDNARKERQRANRIKQGYETVKKEVDRLTKVNDALAKLEKERKEARKKKDQEIERLKKLNSELADLKEDMERVKKQGDYEREKYLREKEERVKEEKELIQANVQDYSTKKEKQFDNYLACVSQLPDPPKTLKNSVAFLGKTSCGKSTMVNKIYGTNCKTSPLRCTEGAEMVYDSDKLEVYDVFGVNDEQTYANTNMLLKTKTLHSVVCIYTDSVDHVFDLARLLNVLELNIVFVRNKCEDFSADDMKAVKQHDESKLRGIVNKENFLGVIIGSGKSGLGMKALSNTITMSSNQQIMDDEKIDDITTAYV
jgi:hypothetical protein